MKTRLIILAFLLLLNGLIIAQDKLSLYGGIGFPDLIHIGVGYKVLDQAKIGLSIGWWPPGTSG